MYRNCSKKQLHSRTVPNHSMQMSVCKHNFQVFEFSIHPMIARHLGSQKVLKYFFQETLCGLGFADSFGLIDYDAEITLSRPWSSYATGQSRQLAPGHPFLCLGSSLPVSEHSCLPLMPLNSSIEVLLASQHCLSFPLADLLKLGSYQTFLRTKVMSCKLELLSRAVLQGMSCRHCGQLSFCPSYVMVYLQGQLLHGSIRLLSACYQQQLVIPLSDLTNLSMVVSVYEEKLLDRLNSANCQ